MPPRPLTLLGLLLALLCVKTLAANELCASGTCLANGETVCDRATGNCPPCMYAITGGYSCYAKTDSKCPFPDTLAVCKEARSDNILSRLASSIGATFRSLPLLRRANESMASNVAAEVGTVAPAKESLV